MATDGSSTTRSPANPLANPPGPSGVGSSVVRAGNGSPNSTSIVNPQPGEIGWDQSPTVVRSIPSSQILPVDRRDEANALIGTQLGEYVLEAPVGGGGMGMVFRAFDLRLQRTVAVKVLTSRWDRDGELKRRFQNEAQSAARLNHENIATIFDVGESHGWSYIVFEFLEGINVRDLVLRDGPLPIDSAIHITRQMAHALAHAATRDVVHRDIKPSNILLTPDNRAKLVDMGLARLHDARPAEGELTASGVTLGTFDYISPEQAQDPRQADLRSDVYSLGCTLYFMLCGHPPFPDGTVLQKLMSHTTEEAPDPRAYRTDIPAGLLQVLRRMMAKDPRDRYQHPEVLIADLAALQQGRQLYPDIRRRTPPSLWLHLPWLVPASLLVAGVCLGEAFWNATSGDFAKIPEFRMPLVVDRTGASPTGGTVPHPSASNSEPNPVSPSLSEPPQSPPPDSTLPPPMVSPPARRGPEEDPTGDPTVPPRAPTTQPAVTPTRPEPLRAVVARAVYSSEDAFVAKSLAEAVRYCDQHPHVHRIEIEVDGELDVGEPFRVGLRELTITAAEGFSPVLRFVSRESSEDSHLVTLLSGSLLWKDLNVVWQIPRNVAAPQGFMLVPSQAACEWEHCSISIQQEGGANPNREANSFITVTPTASLSTSVSPADGNRLASRITMRNTLVRGECRFLDIQGGASVHFMADQIAVLLADRFFRFRELSDSDKRRSMNRLSFDHAVIECESGMGSVTSGLERLGIPEIEIDVQRSVLHLPSSQPLFRHEGSGLMQDYLRTFHYRGEQNIYRGEGRFWEIDARGNDYHDSFSWTRWQAHWHDPANGQDIGSQYVNTPRSALPSHPLHATPFHEIRALVPESQVHIGSGPSEVGPDFGSLLFPD